MLCLKTVKIFCTKWARKYFGNELEPFEDVSGKSRLQKQFTLGRIMKKIRGESEGSEWLLVFLPLPASPANKETIIIVFPATVGQ